MNITLELTASPTLLEALKLLAGFANPVASFVPVEKVISAPEAAQTQKKTVEESRKTTDDRSANETTREVTTATTETTTVQTDLTVEQVRAATSAKAKSGKRAEVKALLSKYGTDSVTNLDAAHYAAFYTELEAL